MMIDDHHQKLALGIVVAFPILGGLAVILRLWSRGLSRSALTSGMLAPRAVPVDRHLAIIRSLLPFVC